jgi:hypothetical protein
LTGEDSNGVPNNLMPYFTQVGVGKLISPAGILWLNALRERPPGDIAQCYADPALAHKGARLAGAARHGSNVRGHLALAAVSDQESFVTPASTFS